MKQTRKNIGTQLREFREKRGLTLQQVADRAMLTADQCHNVECGLGLFSTARKYAAGLSKRITVRGFVYRHKDRRAAELARVTGMDPHTVLKCVRAANSPENTEDVQVIGLESVIWAWSPEATLMLGSE